MSDVRQAQPPQSRPGQTAPMTAIAVQLGPWSPLRARVFRALWIASLVSNVGTTMHTVGASWAITELSTSTVVISLVQAAWTIPGFLLAVPAGVFADVLDRRRLILVSQFVAMLFAAALGLLETSRHLTTPLLLAGTFFLSIVLTMSAPAFMALIPDLVEPDALPQAIGLNNISYNGAQSLGPALAGIVIAVSGPGAVFLLNAASFLGIVVVMFRFRPARPGPTSDEGVLAAMGTGVRYFRAHPRLQRFALRIMLAFLVTSSVPALLPIDARRRLHTTAAQFGLLSAAIGVGAVLAVWAMPRLRRAASPDGIILAAALTWATGASIIAFTTTLWAGVIGVLLTGAAAMATMNITYSLFMLMLPAWIRGRASSVVMLMVWLGASMGTVLWGTLASHLGIPHILAIAAAAQIIVVGTATARFRLETADIGGPDGEPSDTFRR